MLSYLKSLHFISISILEQIFEVHRAGIIVFFYYFFFMFCHYFIELIERLSDINIFSCCSAFACFPAAVFVLLVSTMDYFQLVFPLWVCLWTVCVEISAIVPNPSLLVTAAWLLYNQHYMAWLKMQIWKEMQFGGGFVSTSDDHVVSIFWLNNDLTLNIMLH